MSDNETQKDKKMALRHLVDAARLQASPPGGGDREPPGPSTAETPTSRHLADVAQTLKEERARRLRYFSRTGDLFQEPCWDMVLRLFIAQEAGVAISLHDLAADLDLPSKLTERWLAVLEDRDLAVSWLAPPGDGRVIALTPAAVAAMVAYLSGLDAAVRGSD